MNDRTTDADNDDDTIGKRFGSHTTAAAVESLQQRRSGGGSPAGGRMAIAQCASLHDDVETVGSRSRDIYPLYRDEGTHADEIGIVSTS